MLHWLVALEGNWKCGEIASPATDDPVIIVTVTLDLEVLLCALGRFGSVNTAVGLPPQHPSELSREREV